MNGANGHRAGVPSPAYVDRAITEECAAIENAAPSTANDTLHKAAVKLGTLSGAGVLDRSAAEAALQDAAAKRCDDQREARATIKSGLNWGEAHPRKMGAKAMPRSTKRLSERKDARAIFDAAQPITGTLAERYLAGRKLTPPLPSSLRFALEVQMPAGGKHPALIAAVVIPTTGDLIAVQRTALAPDGNGKAAIKPAKASIGSTSDGAVVLGNLDGASTILEGEGIETVLSARQATGLPGIATLSAGTLGKPLLPEGCAVIILGDRGSEKLTEVGAERRHKEGRNVRIAYPPGGSGKDFNDLLASSGADAVQVAIEAAAEFKPMSASSYSARCLADIEAKPVQWLWPDRFARGKLNLIAGHPGRGKSTLTLHMAAIVSTGGTWPDDTRCPIGNVIFITCEDDAADTLVPRLTAAGADRSRCHLLDTVNDGKGGERPFNLKTDTDVLADMARDLGGVSLVVIDPISAYLDGIDSHKVAEVRGGLVPLQQFADRTSAAIILVSHFNKGTPDGSAMSRVAGSGAFVAVCRSAWAVDRDPEQPTGSRRILTPMKNNIGDDRTGFAFELEPFKLDNGIGGSRVRFLPGTVSISADEFVRSQALSKSRSSALSEATAFLANLLAAGKMRQSEIEGAAKEAGYHRRTLQRAKKSLGIKSRKQPDGWWWEWPKQHLLQSGLFDDQECQGCQERQDCSEPNTGDLEPRHATDRNGANQGCQLSLPENVGTLGDVGDLEPRERA